MLEILAQTDAALHNSLVRKQMLRHLFAKKSLASMHCSTKSTA
jgi:hypothetical protein